MTKKTACFALVPAAGAGARMGSEIPKQYLPLADRPLLWHALHAMCSVDRIEMVFVVLSPEDAYWVDYNWSQLGQKLVPLRCGGDTRAESVRNGLVTIADRVAVEDWILVHDAARACITPSQVNRLMDAVGDDPVGGILAMPVADTLKHSDSDGRIDMTVPREGLWQAQTPQMFRHGMLLSALGSTRGITDEAGAIEALGFRPKLVVSDASNLKVTWSQDLQLAEWILKEREMAKGLV